METIVGIHQPSYLPWLGFFKKIDQCDKFVFFDDVPINKKSFHNRNKIKTTTGNVVLTVPIMGSQGTKINEIKIDNTKKWSMKHKKTILLNYSKSKFFENYKEEITSIYDKKYDLLIDLDINIIKFLMKEFKINTKIFFSSKLGIFGKTPDKILEICKSLNATTYVTGITWAKENLNKEKFAENNIKIQFQEFIHPKYNQCFGKFIEGMSAIDLLFNEGKNSKNIIKNSNIKII